MARKAEQRAQAERELREVKQAIEALVIGGSKNGFRLVFKAVKKRLIG